MTVLGNAQFYAQEGEDKWLLENRASDLPKHGKFIDVGAGDGQFFNNTLFFELNGWTGLCIEPDSRHQQYLAERRELNLQVAVGTNPRKVTLYKTKDPHHSSLFESTLQTQDEPIIDTEDVTLLTLDEIMETFGYIYLDLLSIDAEGNDLDILKSINLQRFFVRFIIVEHLPHGGIDRLTPLSAYLNNQGYSIIHSTSANLILERK